MEKHLVPYGSAAKMCRKLDPDSGTPDKVDGRPLYGCQFWRETTCVVVYSFDPTRQDAKMTSNVFRHEQAHCNGWPSNHPGELP
jgi:hypothetical protein